MYYECSQEELRSYCRSCIESFELWARRLINEKMVECYGVNYVDAENGSGEKIIKASIRDHIHDMMNREPARFQRAVDTLFVEDIIYFLCNPKWYKKLFKKPLEKCFPQGNDEAREFLMRLVPVRNALSHANPISVRQAEQAICYSHDFVESLKEYYREKGKEHMWNVPSIIRIMDSRGNVFIPNESSSLGKNYTITPEFYVGDSYTIHIEVDPAFPPSSYTILWSLRGRQVKEYTNMTQFSITFSPKEIGESVMLECKVITKNEWHRHYGYDDKTYFFVTVFPPND